MSRAPFLSVNEKRLATGYGPIEGGDVFQSRRIRNKIGRPPFSSLKNASQVKRLELEVEL